MSITPAPQLSLADISGEPYDIGVQLGHFGKDIVNAYLTKTRIWAAIIARGNSPHVMQMQAQVQERFPRYWLELQGLAQGLGLPFDDVFAWNCRGDIDALAPDGCTTVQLPGIKRCIAHNEDGDPGLRGHCALARVRPAGGTAFTAFVYPGSLPGHTFAATDAGLIQAVNNIRPRDFGNGLPRMVLGRAVLDCQSLDDAVTLLQTSDRAGAFHLTLAARDDPRLLGIEFTADKCSVQEITAPAAHANHLIHGDMIHIRQTITDSSAARQQRTATLLAEQGAAPDPLAILRDKAGPGLPIRRDDPQDPDQENTLATAYFAINDDGIQGRVFDTDTTRPGFAIDNGMIREI